MKVESGRCNKKNGKDREKGDKEEREVSGFQDDGTKESNYVPLHNRSLRIYHLEKPVWRRRSNWLFRPLFPTLPSTLYHPLLSKLVSPS